MSLTYREAAVAGYFYSNNTQELQSNIKQHILKSTSILNTHTKALIVPHAGHVYSGDIAANAYKSLNTNPSAISNIILLGPSHHIAFKGIALSSASYFNTPLGEIKINRFDINKIKHLKFVNYNDDAHKNEHSLEVQLPFLQTLLKQYTIVPLLVGDCSATEISALIKILWGGQETVIIISSDLSHFHDYQAAKKLDQFTSQAIINYQIEKIHFENACGKNAINGFLKRAQQFNLSASILDVRNSGDTAGDKNRVVGYGAYLFQ